MVLQSPVIAATRFKASRSAQSSVLARPATPWLPRHADFARFVFAGTAAAAEATAVLATAAVTDLIYHWASYGQPLFTDIGFRLGCLIAILFVAFGLAGDDYRPATYLATPRRLKRPFLLWNLATAFSMLVGFLTRSTTDMSRGTAILLYAAGFATLWGVRILVGHWARRHSRPGGLVLRRAFLVGTELEVRRFTQRHEAGAAGVHIVGAIELRGDDTLEDDLALARATARLLQPEDVFILLPWSNPAAIDAAIDAFLGLPAALRLGADPVLDRFGAASLEQTGPIASVTLTRRPLNGAEILLKRAFDIAAASAALVLLSPVLLAVAIAIKLDSAGPVLFRQRRYGFNQQPFRIFKFRSMRVLEDSRHLRQAARNDPRVTRVGRLLRRLNLDELPQLLNVLAGDMSLVGPRPHALVHDQLFGDRIALYARRHNVKPGITGWAQVNGHRGETATSDHMRARVEHDLYYIDHWSVWLDLRILVMTVLSSKAYRNAH